MQERRKYVRIPDNSRVSYSMVNAKDKGDCLVKDISVGGIRFLVHQFIPKNSLLKIRVVLCNTSAAFEGVVKVMWTRQLPYSSDHEVGVQFVDIPKKSTEQLLEYVKTFLHKK